MGLPILEEHGESGICVVTVFWLRCWFRGEWAGGLGQDLRGWRGVMSVCVVSLDYLC